MDITLARKKIEAALEQLRTSYSMAIHFGQTHDVLLESISKIRSTTLKGCPRWAIAEFYGYQRALSDNLYRTSLVFGGMVDGKFFSTHSNRDDYYVKNGIEPSAYADNGLVKDRGHYWDSTPPRPFFIAGA